MIVNVSQQMSVLLYEDVKTICSFTGRVDRPTILGKRKYLVRQRQDHWLDGLFKFLYCGVSQDIIELEL
jgi:hypothetical protein